MSVTIRQRRKGGWEIDIRVVAPDGSRHARTRKRSTGVTIGRPAVGRGPGTYAVPAPDASASRHHRRRADPTRVRAKIHRRPCASQPAEAERDRRQGARPARSPGAGLGSQRLDTIKSEDVQRLKRALQTKSPKTVNNVLAVLSVLLKKAVEWEVIERMPWTMKLLPVTKGRRRSTISTSTKG